MHRFICAAAVVALMASASFGTVVLDETFTYPDGALVGQGGWAQTGSVATNPIQVVNGQALLGTGQDVYKAFAASVPNTAGTSLYTGFDITVSTPTSSGDYFLHLSDPAGTTSNFWQRVFVKSSGAGFQLGLVDTAGTNSSITYSPTVLDLNTSYRVVVGWNFVDGNKNDTFAMYLDPASDDEGSNTPFLTHTWTSTSVNEPSAQLAAANLRQGGSSSAPGVKVDDFVVSTTFAEAVPEPASLALLALGGLALLRRRN